jgi:hypothetical protein
MESGVSRPTSPVPVDLDLGELIDRLYDDFALAECNEALARMYGVTARSCCRGRN